MQRLGKALAPMGTRYQPRLNQNVTNGCWQTVVEAAHAQQEELRALLSHINCSRTAAAERRLQIGSSSVAELCKGDGKKPA